MQDLVTGGVEAPYVVGGITNAQNQACGEFAGFLYTTEDTATIYFAFAQNPFINDNSYRLNAIGCDFSENGQTIKDILQSAHIEVHLLNCNDNLALDFFLDCASTASYRRSCIRL